MSPLLAGDWSPSACRTPHDGHEPLNVVLPGRSVGPAAKTVLKPPHSKRWRDGRTPSDFEKRLECGAFTAAVWVGLPVEHWAGKPKPTQMS
jgi:hypothetical protein